MLSKQLRLSFGKAEQNQPGRILRTDRWFTSIQDNLAIPFQTSVLGVDITVQGIALSDDGRIVAVCTRGRDRQTLPILDLPLPRSEPEGSEWIEAYRHWLGRR
jgi:hypothetical protein